MNENEDYGPKLPSECLLETRFGPRITHTLALFLPFYHCHTLVGESQEGVQENICRCNSPFCFFSISVFILGAELLINLIRSHTTLFNWHSSQSHVISDIIQHWIVLKTKFTWCIAISFEII